MEMTGMPSEKVKLRETLDVFCSWSNRIRGSSEVTLVEGPDLIRREGPNDCVQHAPVVEEYEILL